MKSMVPNSAKAFRYDEEGGIGYGTIDEGKFLGGHSNNT